MAFRAVSIGFSGSYTNAEFPGKHLVIRHIDLIICRTGTGAISEALL